MAFASCGEKKNELMQGIYEKLTAADSSYSEWKSGFNATTFEEKLDGEAIVITAKGEEGMNGEYIEIYYEEYDIHELPPLDK